MREAGFEPALPGEHRLKRCALDQLGHSRETLLGVLLTGFEPVTVGS